MARQRCKEEELDELLETAWKRQKWARTRITATTNKAGTGKRAVDPNTAWPLVGLIVCLILFIVVRNKTTIVIAGFLLAVCLAWLAVHLASVRTKSRMVRISICAVSTLAATLLVRQMWPTAQREVVVTRVEIMPFMLNQPVRVNVHFINHSPDTQFNGFFQADTERDVIVAGGDPNEQRKIEEELWKDFIKTTQTLSPEHHVDLVLPVDVEKVLPEVIPFGAEAMHALVDGDKSLYVMGMIRNVRTGQMTPYCVIKSPHMPGITYCQEHN